MRFAKQTDQRLAASRSINTAIKDGGSGEDFNKDSIERDERRLTELGRRTIEIFVLAHIFSKIEVAYNEAVALKRQEELIREEAAWLAETEQKAKRGAAEKEKKLKKKQAHVFTSEAGDCAAFLSNYDTKSVTRVMFNNMHCNLPPWSISILPDCRNLVFNTAKVGVQTSQMEMLPSNAEMFSWDTYNEDISSLDDSLAFSSVGLLEQINVTRDASDILFLLLSFY